MSVKADGEPAYKRLMNGSVHLIVCLFNWIDVKIKDSLSISTCSFYFFEVGIIVLNVLFLVSFAFMVRNEHNIFASHILTFLLSVYGAFLGRFDSDNFFGNLSLKENTKSGSS